MNELEKTQKNDLVVDAQVDGGIQGFEDSNQEDIVIPRLKVINALSPERKDKIAEEGDIVNSLTKEIIGSTDRFVPVKQYYTNIEWNPDRDGDQRIFCRSFDGRIGTDFEGITYACATCKKNKFDNTKEGKEAQPSCTSYMNFLGFMVGNPMPLILSFAKTNYNEGKKMLSIAKSLMKSIWSYGYILEGKEITKGKNSWFIITSKLAEPTDAATQAMAVQIFKTVAAMPINADYEDASGSYQAPPVCDETTESEI